MEQFTMVHDKSMHFTDMLASFAAKVYREDHVLSIKCLEEKAKHDKHRGLPCDHGMVLPQLNPLLEKVMSDLETLMSKPCITYHDVADGDSYMGRPPASCGGPLALEYSTEATHPPAGNRSLSSPDGSTSHRSRSPKGPSPMADDSSSSDSRSPRRSWARRVVRCQAGPVQGGHHRRAGSPPAAEDEACCLYVMNIRTKHRHLPLPELREFMSKYGDIADTHLLDDARYPCACVVYASPISVEQVLSHRPISMDDGHRLYIQERPSPPQAKQCPPGQRVFLPDLHPDLREEDLLPTLLQYGDVLDMRIQEGPKGVYGLATFASDAQAREVTRRDKVYSDQGRGILVRPCRK